MDNTPKLSLPYIMSHQALKHVTHNQALQGLDALTQLSAADRDLTSPPLTPDEGDRLYRTSRIVILAEEVFGNREKAIRWLEKPRRALGGISALAAVTTTPGYEAVEELLQRLHYGFTA